MSIFTTYLEWLERVCGKTNPVYRLNLTVYQRTREFCLSRIRRLRLRGKKGSAPVKLYFFHGKQNFGDRLNLDVMRHYGLEYSISAFEDANMICIGSILDKALLTDSKTVRFTKPLHVLGAGFIIGQEDETERFNRPVKLHCLRGKLTLDRCKRMTGTELSDVVLGDPGLLVKRIFPDLKPKNPCDVGIVCHYSDRKASCLKNICPDGLRVKTLDVALETGDFLEEMAGCDFILSSSLHGLICADSLGIPNKAVILSGNVEGNGYKFRDYYSVFGMEYDPVDLRKNNIMKEDIESYKKQYGDLTSEIEKICDSLDVVFRKIKEDIELKRR